MLGGRLLGRILNTTSSNNEMAKDIKDKMGGDSKKSTARG